MKNKYVTKMRNAMNDLKEIASRARDSMEYNTKTYVADIAKDKNAQIWAGVQNKHIQLRESFINDYLEIRSALAKARFPRVECLSAERNLLSELGKITSQEYMAFSDLHPNNVLWQRTLLEKMGDSDDMAYAEARMFIESRMPEAQLKAYQQIFESAISLLDGILDGTVNDAVYDGWMNEEYGVSKNLYETVGSGNCIYEYSEITGIPQRAEHVFDSVTLHDSSGLEITMNEQDALHLF